ncbi:hypothetical protein MBLNU230_g5569t1 [Neophaeotheca triangularis]
MVLEQHPFTEADIPLFTQIMDAAFADGLMAVMFPDPNTYTETSRQQAHTHNLHDLRTNPNIHFFKILDTSLPSDDPYGRCVAVTKWHLHPTQRDDSALDAEEATARSEPLPPGMNPEFAAAFFGQLGEYKRKNLGGSPYLLLHILAVLPNQHRKGVGKLALQWGLRAADERDLPVYLESSPMGKGLYEKFGFEVLNWLPFDAREFGGREALRHACMLRPRRSKRRDVGE